MQPAGSQPSGTTEGHHEHHGLVGALETAGEAYVEAILSIVGPHKPEHWEGVLEQYEKEHPKPDDAG
jgi:hypothetical protein